MASDRWWTQTSADDTGHTCHIRYLSVCSATVEAVDKHIRGAVTKWRGNAGWTAMKHSSLFITGRIFRRHGVRIKHWILMVNRIRPPPQFERTSSERNSSFRVQTMSSSNHSDNSYLIESLVEWILLDQSFYTSVKIITFISITTSEFRAVVGWLVVRK